MNLLNNIFLCAAAVYRCYTIYAKGGELAPSRPLSDKVYAVILGVTVFVLVFVRIYKFGQIPGGFNQDGAMAAVDALALANHGTDRLGMFMPVHLTAWGYGQMSALLSYLMVPFIKAMGLWALPARLPQLLVSFGGLACVYLLMRDVFGKNCGLIALVFAAICPWHLLQSRWALDCNLYPLFFIIGVYFLNRYVRKKGVPGKKEAAAEDTGERVWKRAGRAIRWRIPLILSMIAFGLCMYCYGISIYTMPVFLLAACIYLLVKKAISWKDVLMAAVVYLLVAWPFILTMAVNFFGWETIETPFFTIPYFKDSVRSNDILFFSEDLLAQLKVNFQSVLDKVFLQKKDLPWNDIEGFGTVYLFTMPFVFAGIAALFKFHRKDPGAILCFLFFLTGIWAGLTTNSVNVNRINIVYYPVIILAAAGIYYAVRLIPHAVWGVAAAYGIAFVMLCTTYFTTYADQIGDQFYEDFTKAVYSLEDREADRYYITADIQYEGYWNVSEIVTMFCLQTDAEYYQGVTDNGDIPYRDKYVYVSMKNLTIDPNENAVYVIKDSDRVYFSEQDFALEQFGSYWVAAPK